MEAKAPKPTAEAKKKAKNLRSGTVAQALPKTHEEVIAHLLTVHFLELEGVDITTIGGIISAMKLL